MLGQRERRRRIDLASDQIVGPRHAAIRRQHILDQVQARAGGRINWVIGSGGTETRDILSRMYQKGYSGPLWEFLIR